MAHLLQRLTPALLLLGCGVLPAQQKPFSHRLHLAMKLQCAGCHASVTTSTKASDNNLPDPKVCAPCHKQPMAIKAPRQTFVATFNHQQHLKLGNVAPAIAAAIDSKAYLSTPPPELREQLRTSANPCAACHRGLETSEAVSKAAFPLMADCLVCHTNVDPPFSCPMCHGQTDAIKPAGHTREFADKHSTGKLGLDKTTCAVCHGRKFSCLGCHSA